MDEIKVVGGVKPILAPADARRPGAATTAANGPATPAQVERDKNHAHASPNVPKGGALPPPPAGLAPADTAKIWTSDLSKESYKDLTFGHHEMQAPGGKWSLLAAHGNQVVWADTHTAVNPAQFKVMPLPQQGEILNLLPATAQTQLRDQAAKADPRDAVQDAAAPPSPITDAQRQELKTQLASLDGQIASTNDATGKLALTLQKKVIELKLHETLDTGLASYATLDREIQQLYDERGDTGLLAAKIINELGQRTSGIPGGDLEHHALHNAVTAQIEGFKKLHPHPSAQQQHFLDDATALTGQVLRGGEKDMDAALKSLMLLWQATNAH